jgi:tetraacyldisaccharide 4'-kinase
VSIEQSRFVYPQSERADFFTKTLSKALSLLFGFLTSIRNATFDLGIRVQHRLPGKVYSVGNIAVGGTGKTPVVIALVKHLQLKGLSPIVLTRGYGSGLKKNDWIVLQNGIKIGGNVTPQQLPDEARLQSIECSGIAVIAGSNRLAAAQKYLQTFSDVKPTHWILDDGFQHRRIHRDIDIVLIDKTSPVGNGWFMPYGFLRESLFSLKRATHVFLTGNGSRSSTISQCISEINPKIFVEETFVQSEKLVTDVSGLVSFSEIDPHNIFIVAGIARPERFLQDLEIEGVLPNKRLFLPDHHPISRSILSESLGTSSAVITTAKDYWRNPEVFGSLKIPVFVKKIEIILPASMVNQFD